MKRRSLRPAIGDRHANERISRCRFGVLDPDVEIPIAIKNSGIEEFKFLLFTPAPRVLLDQLLVWKSLLGVFVQRPAIAVRWRRILVIVKFLHVLAMVALRAGQTEQAFLE